MEILISSPKFKEYEKIISFCFQGNYPNSKEIFEKEKTFLIHKLAVLPWESLTDFIKSEMSVKFRSETSMNGQKLDILKSGIQKYIRRSNFEKAIWCCIELDLFAYVEGGEKIRTNMIHRLMVIYLEEIGLSNLGILERVNYIVFELLSVRKLRKEISSNQKFRKIRKKEMKLLIEVVYLLSTSEHGRMLSHYNSVITRYDEIPEASKVAKMFYPSIIDIRSQICDLPFPKLKILLGKYESVTRKEVDNIVSALELSLDCALFWADKVIEKVKDIEKREKHYNRKNPEFLVFYVLDEYIEKYKPFPKKYFDVCKRWFIELKIKENFMCFSILILMILRAKELPFESEKYKSLDLVEIYSKNLRNESIEIDEFVIDMHTRKGKMEGSGKKIFATEGAKVENESKLVNVMYKNFYTDVGIAKESFDDLSLEESSVFEFEIRAQLICARTRPDTYFAFSKKENRNVFVKGPYLTKEHALMPLRIFRLKQILNMRAVPVSMIKLIPDSIETPLGSRTQIEKDKKYPFLIFKDMTKHTHPLPFIEKESKLWPPTRVVDWSKVEECTIPIIFDLKKELLLEYIITLLFRYALGIPDMADRNFLKVGDEIYGVDEESWGKVVNLRSSLKEKKSDFIKGKVEEMSLELIVVFDGWLKLLNETKAEYPSSFKTNLEKMIDPKFLSSLFE